MTEINVQVVLTDCVEFFLMLKNSARHDHEEFAPKDDCIIRSCGSFLIELLEEVHLVVWVYYLSWSFMLCIWVGRLFWLFGLAI